MNLKIKTTYTTQSEIEIPVPSFYKEVNRLFDDNIKKVVGILDEETMVTVFHSPGYTNVSNESTENRDEHIAKIVKTYEIATEEEFFEVFNQAYAALELMPVKKFYANGMINATI